MPPLGQLTHDFWLSEVNLISPHTKIFLGVGVLEWINHDGKMTMEDMHKDSTREVGQFSLPFYGASQLKGKSEAQVADIKLKELKNGRLAMLGKTSKPKQELYYRLSIFENIELLTRLITS